MRFCSLGSGSRGNALLVEGPECRLLFDAGFSSREIERRLRLVDVEPQSIDALFITHEHGDHVKGVAAFARRHDVEVWMTPGTWRALGTPDIPGARLLSGQGQTLRVDGLRIDAFPIPHDAREPCQYVVEGAGRRLGMLTDAGHVSAHAASLLRDSDGLILEMNHDPERLRHGPYPPSLKRRVGGDFGHLSNAQAAELLDECPLASLSILCVAHVSETNNDLRLVTETIERVSSRLMERTLIFEQDAPSAWCAV